MSIKMRKDPSEASETMRANLSMMMSKQAFRTPNLLRLSRDRTGRIPEVQAALPTYNLGLEELAREKDIKQAKEVGWRYLLKENREVIASIDILTRRNERPVFAQTNEGPYVRGISKALTRVAEMDEVQRTDFEARVLTVPALKIVALWLKDDTGNDDLIMPIEPTPPPLVPNKEMSVKEFLEVVGKQAEELLAHYTSDEMGG